MRGVVFRWDGERGMIGGDQQRTKVSFKLDAVIGDLALVRWMQVDYEVFGTEALQVKPIKPETARGIVGYVHEHEDGGGYCFIRQETQAPDVHYRGLLPYGARVEFDWYPDEHRPRAFNVKQLDQQ